MDYPEWYLKHKAGEPLTVDDIADAFEDILTLLDRQIEQEAHMGAFDKAKNIVIPDPEKPASEEYRKKHGPNATADQEFREKWGWDPGEQVVLKGSFTAGTQEDISNVATQLDDEGKPYLVAGTARNLMMEYMIVSWTLVDGGRPVEVSLENIRELPGNYQTPILEAIDKLAARGMNKEAQKRFLPSANGHTRESSIQAK